MEFLKSFAYPDEVMALVKFKLFGADTIHSKLDFGNMSEDAKICYDFLKQTSRSFAAVIQALEGDLRHAVCIFYLVLRALDTVEDDMTIPNEEKVPMLRQFYTYLEDPTWCFMESNEKDKMVLEQFPRISAEFRRLAPHFRAVISEITKRMGYGMTVYLETKVESLQDWNQYCHYVAGLVGIGLSRLFSASGLEGEVVGEDEGLANSMGLFLQKTNIIRDYLEDVNDGREFWPKAVWSKYADALGDLRQVEKSRDALHCLNELVTNALRHIPDVVTYMSRLKNQSVFNFCAIPQVMAIGTLQRCYDNYSVFTGVVKIRKGEAVRMIMETTDMDKFKAIMSHFTTLIHTTIESDDPKAKATRKCCKAALAQCKTDHKYKSSQQFVPLYVSGGLVLGAMAWNYWSHLVWHYYEAV